MLRVILYKYTTRGHWCLGCSFSLWNLALYCTSTFFTFAYVTVTLTAVFFSDISKDKDGTCCVKAE